MENVGDVENTQVYQDRGLARPDCSKRRERTCLRYSYGWVKRAGRDGEEGRARERKRKERKIIRKKAR